MDEVDDDNQGDVPFLRQLLEIINLRDIAIDQSDPALLSLPIPACRLLEHLPDHRLRRLRQAGPDPFVLGPWPRGPGCLQTFPRSRSAARPVRPPPCAESQSLTRAVASAAWRASGAVPALPA